MIHMSLLLVILDLNFPFLHLGMSFAIIVYRESEKKLANPRPNGFST